LAVYLRGSQLVPESRRNRRNLGFDLRPTVAWLR